MDKKSGVLVTERLRSRMRDEKMSQSELARRIGMSQPTINRLLKGQAYGTAHLHRIARELRTTPAYLSGETDDPSADAASISFSARERQVLEMFGAISPRDQVALRTLLGSLASAHSVGTAARLPSEDALAAMFEGLLDGIDVKLPLAERARQLAQRLPIALTQLRDVLPAQGGAQPAPAASAKARADLAIADRGSQQ